MLLFKTIIEEAHHAHDASDVIDFTKYNMSELSPVSSPSQNRKLGLNTSDVAKFLANAPEIIARNLAYWFHHPDLKPDAEISYTHFQQIENIARGKDHKLTIAALSLLVHSSKFKLSVFIRFVSVFGSFREATPAESASQQVLDRALNLLKSEPFVQVLTDSLNAQLDIQARVDTSYVRNRMDECVISQVYFPDYIIKAWNTPTGFVINVRGLDKYAFETLNNHVALACLIGHQMQHFLNRQVTDDLNISTPELLKNKTSAEASNLKSKVPKNLFFEFAAFGCKFTFRKPDSRQLIAELTRRLNASPVCLPLIREDEQDLEYVKQCKCKTLNLPFGFDYALDEEDIVIE